MKSHNKYLQQSATVKASERWKEADGWKEVNHVYTIQQSPQPAWQPPKYIAFNNSLFPILAYNNIFGLHQAYNVLGTF